MTGPDKDALDRLLYSLAECAGQIDQTFSVAGEQLGQGLSVFDSLKDSLAALSHELCGENLRKACEGLEEIAGNLEALRGKLPSETASLTAIGAESRVASVSFERLLGSMRLICILARSARIEAASVTDRGREFGQFADEIVELALRSQKAVEACMRQHAGLSTLLYTALASQRTFKLRYGTAIARLAEGLRRSLADVDVRQQKCVVLTREAAVNSGKIAVAAGGAIMTLQTGDAIRQRLEHALVAMPMAAEFSWDSDDTRQGLSPTGKEALATTLYHLQERQLDATAKTLRHDVLDIDDALRALAENTAPLMDIGRSLYGGDISSASFLQALTADLVQAAEILRECQYARQGVEHVTHALTCSLDSLHETVSALESTVASILLIGTNASLRAARLGQGGRSLVVIAQEMKTVATEIASDAEKMRPVLKSMQLAAQNLGRQDRRVHTTDTLDAAMERSLAAIGASGEKLGDTLAKLSRASTHFAAVIGNARLMFSNAALTADAIQGGAAILAQSGRTLPPLGCDDHSVIASFLASVIRPTYTMIAERAIHDAVLTALSLAPKAEVARDDENAKGVDDDFLF